MPCVFPVLSLKVLGLRDAPTTASAALKRGGSRSRAGVVITFVALGLALAALRAAGEQLGWGFQLQSPAVVTALARPVLRAGAQSVGRVRVRPARAVGSRGLQSSQNRIVDAFGSGVLAVVIASPCTAPFMGAALGYALAGSTAS